MKSFAVIIAFVFVFALSNEAKTEICNPDCDPPLCDKISAAAERDANQGAKIYDTYIDSKTADFVDKCFKALNQAFWINIGIPLPSLDDLLGALCEIAKYSSEKALQSLNKQLNLSILDGAVNIGGGTNTGGGLKVQDTSSAARNSLLRLLR